jgi:hypothetical protein
MPSNKLAVYTTVYPGVQKYLGAWAHSISQQTDSHFDLWIGVDSLDIEEIVKAFGKELHPNWVLNSRGRSSTQLRITAINELALAYSSIVFVDSDDLLDPSRIEAARSYLENFGVVATALRIINETGNDLGLTFGIDHDRDIDSLMPRYNVFGLSNTAYRAEVLRCCLPLSDESELLDWQLATRAWIKGASLGFDHTPRMFYRQYGSNSARVLQPFSARYVSMATLKVLDHYRCLVRSREDMPLRFRDQLLVAGNRVEKFFESISRSKETLEKYVESLNRIEPEYVWWWCIAHPELEAIWNN